MIWCLLEVHIDCCLKKREPVRWAYDVVISLIWQDLYEKPRQTENGLMMAALDGLKRVFAPQSGLLASLRGVGLDIINGNPELKRQIMKYAMGIR